MEASRLATSRLTTNHSQRLNSGKSLDTGCCEGHGTQKNLSSKMLSSKEINSFDLLPLTFRLKFLTVIG